MGRKKHFLFYVSSHGFGHSTRMIEVANHIPAEHKITFATMAPEWIYDVNLTRPFDIISKKIDIGVKQKDILTLMEEETLKEYKVLLENRDEIIDREVKWIKENRVDAVISDIPPFAFPIAKKTSIPSFAIGNFGWNWIYEPMTEVYPEYKYIIDSIKDDYRKADLLFRLPMHEEMTSFTSVKDMPFIARKSKKKREEVREMLGIGKGKKVILLSFSGFDMTSVDFTKVEEELKDYIIISFKSSIQFNSPNYIRLDNFSGIFHEDALACSDMVITKPGYSIISEAIGNKTKILFTPRKNYIENNVLVKGIIDYCIWEEINNEDFLRGNWKPFIENLLLKEDMWPGADCSGGEVIAKEIFKLIEC